MADRLVDQLRLMAAHVPDAIAYRCLVDDDGTAITFERWERESNRLAHGLSERGIGKGDLVAVDLEPEQVLDWIVAYSAVHKLGAVAVPLNDRLTAAEVQVVLEHAEVAAVVAGGRAIEAVAPLVGRLGTLSVVVTVGEDPLGLGVDVEVVKSDDETPVIVEVGDDDLADVMYTSGTTGRPKGVVVRHGGIAMTPNVVPRWSGAGWLTATPVFTFAGLGFIYNPMKLGMTVLHLPRFDAGRWLGIVERERPPIAFLVPAMARLLLHHPDFETADLSSLSKVVFGSAPLAPDTVERLQARLPGADILNSYGMTEGGYATFAMDPEGARTRPAAVGRPRPGVEVRIAGDDDRTCAPGEVGEVLTRNPAGHREYYKDPGATARMWEGGWLHTGDLGYYDEEGYLFISGRKKEMIVRGGMNVYADDVEAVLQSHPDVVEAAVVGVPHEVLGEDLAAFVVPREEGALDGDDLRRFAAEQLADYKVPRRVEFVDALPRNAGGKVVKALLLDAAGDGPGAARR